MAVAIVNEAICSSESENEFDNDMEFIINETPQQSYSDAEIDGKMGERGRKRPSHPQLWSDNRRKRRRNAGRCYTTRAGKFVKEKAFSPSMHCCKAHCYESIKPDEQQRLFRSFYAMGMKNEQDKYIAGLLTRKDVARRRSKTVKPKKASWKFSFSIEGYKHGVCKKFFLDVLKITEGRVRRIQDKIVEGVTNIMDKRGLHHNRPKKIPDGVWKITKEYLASIPHKESHYSRKKTSRKYFENPDLNVKKLHRGLKKFYETKTGNVLNLSYESFRNYFAKNSEYSFRLPRSDVCDTCTELKFKTGDVEAQAKLKLHLEKWEAYKKLKKMYIDKCKAADNQRLLVIEFDYAQNLALPKINVTAQFYKRLLWMFMFNVHIHNTDSSQFYCFLEGASKKNPNSVCSMLYNALCEIKKTLPFKHVVCFSDACGGQNKNSVMVQFLFWVAKSMNVEIVHIFPVRGHSYCVCDRNFGVCSNAMKRKETVETMPEYIEILKAARTNPSPFTVIEAANLLMDFEKALLPFFVKTPTMKKIRFSIQKYVQLKFSPTSSGVQVSQFYGNEMFSFFNMLKKGKVLPAKLNLEQSPKGVVKQAKINDLRDLLRFLSPDGQRWLEGILAMMITGYDSESESDEDSE